MAVWLNGTAVVKKGTKMRWMGDAAALTERLEECKRLFPNEDAVTDRIMQKINVRVTRCDQEMLLPLK